MKEKEIGTNYLLLMVCHEHEPTRLVCLLTARSKRLRTPASSSWRQDWLRKH